MEPDIYTLLQDHRYRHIRILGQTGTGKSTLQANLILRDIKNGHGVLFLDPQGNDIDLILERFPRSRERDLLHFDASDYEHPTAFNSVGYFEKSHRPYVATIIMEMLKSAAWPSYNNIATPRIDLCLYHCLISLLDAKDGTLMDIPLMLTDETYRTKKIKDTNDPFVQRYWKRFKEMQKKDRDTLVESTFSKLQFIMADPHIRHVFGQPKSAFEFSDVLDTSKIVLLRFPQSQLGEEKVRVMGAMMLAAFQSAARNRTEQKPFHVHISQPYLFDGPVLKAMPSDIAKYNVSMTVTYQYMDQCKQELRDALQGNVGTTVCFRVGLKDADYMKDIFPHPDNTHEKPQDLEPFAARIITPTRNEEIDQMPRLQGIPDPEKRDALISLSRNTYGKSREHAEAIVAKALEVS
jgi:hypothetical protein